MSAKFESLELSDTDLHRLNALSSTISAELECTRLDAEDWFLFAGITVDISKEVVAILEKYLK